MGCDEKTGACWLHGCARPQERAHRLTSGEVQTAAHFVEHKASFVGLTNRFEESVCLFHAMYGGLLYHFEAKDFVINHGKQEELHDESVLGDWQDEEDNLVFAAASRK